MYRLRGVFLLHALCLVVSNFAMDNLSRKSSRPDRRLSSSEGQLQKIFSAIENYDHITILVIAEKKPSLINAYAYYKGLRCKVAPLHVAVKLNNILAVELLLRLKADPNAPVKNDEANMPLHIASSVEVAELLVERGAWVNIRNGYGKTPLMKAYARKHSPLFSIAGYLLDQGAEGNVQYNDGSEFLLHKMVRDHKKYAIQQLLEHGVTVDCYNNKGATPLHLAIDAFQDEVMSDMLGQTTSLDYFKKGNVLFYPADLPSYHCPYRLLKDNAAGFSKLKPASEKARQAENILTELFIILQRGKEQKSWQAITTDKKGHCFNRASFTDLEQWVGKDAVNGMKNYIDARCGMVYSETFFKGNERKYYIVQKLIVEQHPFLFAYTIGGFNFYLFSLLTHCGNINDIKWLLSHFVCNLHGEDDDGDTLLHNAMSLKAKPEIIELLMAHGVDCTVLNRIGLTAYALAKKRELVVHEKAFIKGLFKELVIMPCSEIKKLVNNGLSVNVRHPETEVSLLLEASYSGSFEKCSFLLQKGADVNAQGCHYADNKKYSPLLWAVLQKNNNLIVLFLKYGALVTQEMLEAEVCPAIREILQDAYNKQENT